MRNSKLFTFMLCIGTIHSGTVKGFVPPASADDIITTHRPYAGTPGRRRQRLSPGRNLVVARLAGFSKVARQPM